MREGRLGGRPFRFEAAWTLHEDFDSWLRNEWRSDIILLEALQDLTMKLKAWNKATFGNIFKRKKRNELRLGGGGGPKGYFKEQLQFPPGSGEGVKEGKEPYTTTIRDVVASKIQSRVAEVG